MDREAWKRLEPLVDEAFDLSPSELSAFLDRLSVEHASLRGELEAFLAAATAATDFLDAPVEQRVGALWQVMGEEKRSWDALHLEGRRVGPYRVLRELGRGGMGTVFLAERADEQFEQRVALKLVKQGMDSAEILDRFRGERQILARLDHPNIARLLDGGVSAEGQPYFAMEQVEGVPIGLYCDGHRLSIDGRLRLFLQVCDAVEYAHRNLVVHGDLKPSNVLVKTGGQAKLLDFGIAKALDASHRDPEDVPPEPRAMTPRYAAPEQLRGASVTTATDVYSLGLVLYELLAGGQARPRAVTSLAAALGRAGEPEGRALAAELAAARGVSVRRLARILRGDLDRIVGMALREDPEQRYPSVNALAEDLRRFLTGRPVTARPAHLGYRASKFVRRHWLATSGSALLAASLLVGVLGTLWQAREALRQAQRAEEVKRFTFSLFAVSDPDAAKGQEISARQLLERSAARIRTELADEPEVQAEMMLFVGDIHHRLGQDKESLAVLDEALKLRRGRFAADDPKVAEAELALGAVCFSTGELERAEELFGHALQSRLRRLGADHADVAAARGRLGRLRFEKGDLAGAEALLRQAIAVQRRHLPAASADLATDLNALGRVLHAMGDLDAAERLYGEALQMRQRLFGEEHSRVSESRLNLAAVKKDKGEVQAAESQFRQVLAIDRRILGPTQEAVANDLDNLAAALIVEGQYAEAEGLLRESLEVRRRLYGADGPRQAVSLHNLARTLRWQRRLPEAEGLSRRAVALASTRFGEEHPNVATAREELARILADRGQTTEAEDLARQALATYRERLGNDHPRVADGLVTLGHVLAAARRPGEAEGPLREAVRLRQARFGDGDWRTSEASLELGECLMLQGGGAEAAKLLESARQRLERELDPRHPLALRARNGREQAASVAAGPR